MVNQWLNHQLQEGIPTMDEQLWNEVMASFTRRFANNLEKENAQALLKKGLKMKGEDINAYVVEFKELIQMAGYWFDVPQTVETFTDGLPTGLYQKTFKFDQPATYEQWKNAVIWRQQQYLKHASICIKATTSRDQGLEGGHQEGN